VSNPILDQALACAARGWPVFPCQPGRKIPATRRGHLDATIDPARIRDWFGGCPELNLAVATGAPGPDVLDIDTDFATGGGFPALRRLHAVGLIDGAAASVRTPRGGLHYYFAGSCQHTERLPASHVGFLAAGGYALIPPSQIGGAQYWRMNTMYRDCALDWRAAAQLLEPSRGHQRPAPRPVPEERASQPSRWVPAQREGNQSTGPSRAANRLLETGQAVNLTRRPLRPAAQASPNQTSPGPPAPPAASATPFPDRRLTTRPRERADMTNSPVARDHSLRSQPRNPLTQEHPMTTPELAEALYRAERGWPVFPCQPDSKVPATRHGHHDATTDPEQIRKWFSRPGPNLAVATGAPGPDVLDVDTRGSAGNGFAALSRLHAAGLLDGAAAIVRTPSGGLHVYFAGSRQRTAHLPARHLDFLSKGGYVIIPPSQIAGKPYRHAEALEGDGELDWQAAARLLEPARNPRRAAPRKAPGESVTWLAQWVASQQEGNRNAGLYWAANRALETDRAADLSPLAAAARQAGLAEPEITRTVNSARRTSQARPEPPDRQAEGEH
jgi:Bifunctional DNA primase/polymerase, N-terminal